MSTFPHFLVIIYEDHVIALNETVAYIFSGAALKRSDEMLT